MQTAESRSKPCGPRDFGTSARVVLALPSLRESHPYTPNSGGDTGDNFTSRVSQSISGLCSRSHVYPSMRFFFPRLVTARRIRSPCRLYRRIRSTTSIICPPSFGVPSMFRTGTGRESFRVAIPFLRTKSESINEPVAPLSTSALVRNSDLVSLSLVQRLGRGSGARLTR